MRTRNTAPARLVAATIAGALLAACFAADGRAGPQSGSGERYFIDFRARPSAYIGHTYVVYGRVNADGRVTALHYAGLVPEESAWKGFFAPIRGSIRKYKDDTRRLPTIIYRRSLTRAEFRRVGRLVRLMKSMQREWHVVFFNCNDFAIQVAEVLGLRRPPSLLPPSMWVAGLRALNGP